MPLVRNVPRRVGLEKYLDIVGYICSRTKKELGRTKENGNNWHEK